MSDVMRAFGTLGILALGWMLPREALAANSREGVEIGSARICSETSEEDVVVCFGDGDLGPSEQRTIEAEIRAVLEDILTSGGLRISRDQQMLLRVDGTPPNLVLHVEPVSENGTIPAGWGRTFTECTSDMGCTTDDWRGVVERAARQALNELRGSSEEPMNVSEYPLEPSPSPMRPPYRPTKVGIAGIIATSVGGLGMLTGAGLLVVGSLPGNPSPGVRQDRDLLPLSRDFYVPGGVTMGLSAAVAAAGIAMVAVDHRRQRSHLRSKKPSKQRLRIQISASPWRRGARITGRF